MNGRAWTPEEDADLRLLVGLHSYATIGAALDRSAGSVHSRAKTLGITPGPRKGESHPQAKLKTLQAQAVGVLLDAGFTAGQIKDLLQLKVAEGTITDIGRGSSWGKL